MDSREHDVIVMGAGNAALCAALSAREHGAKRKHEVSQS
jgi:succinate dehydrogenase/fumarate reductase flavoprotein subunit